MWHKIQETIRNHQHFLLTTHVNPDGDGIGATSALAELLISMGKDVRIVCDSKIPSKFSFLDSRGLFEIYETSSDYSEIQVIIVLDTHRKDRVGRISLLIDKRDIKTIFIDHHLADGFIEYETLIDPHACSAGAIVYDLFKESNISLNFEAASGIYTSVICDTGRFSYSSTDLKAHHIAEECMMAGVDPDLMYSKVFQHVSMPQIRILIQALQSMETYFDNKVVIQTLSLSDCDKIGFNPFEIENVDLDYIHDFNKLIEDAECVVLLRELPCQQVRVSIRSTSNLDIGKLMNDLGGGGHKHAAGVSIKGSLFEVKQKILELIQENVYSLHKI